MATSSRSDRDGLGAHEKKIIYGFLDALFIMRSKKMRLVLTSDLHGFLPEIPPCDLLLIAGDIVPRKEHRSEKQKEWLTEHFFPWLESQPADRSFFVGGNHDVALEDEEWARGQSDDYLFLEARKYKGITIWGSPYSLGGVTYAFQAKKEKTKEIFQSIPPEVDIVISHGPVRGILDFGQGMKGLRSLVEKSNAHLFLTGHIHDASGFAVLGKTLCINASLCSSDKVPDNPLWIVEWGVRGIEDLHSFYPEVNRDAVPEKVRYGKKKRRRAFKS